MYNSRAFFAGEHRSPVEHTGERVYMREIRLWERLPEDLARWDSLIWNLTAMCGIQDSRIAYLMIDQTVAGPDGMTRRGGWHIDGYWDPGLSGHQRGHTPKHVPIPPSHKPQHSSYGTDWSTATFKEPEGIVLWSDVGALGAWMGEFSGPIGEGGSVPEDVELGGGHSLLQGDNQIICGNVTMLHETLPIDPGRQRTVVRLNVPGWSP